MAYRPLETFEIVDANFAWGGVLSRNDIFWRVPTHFNNSKPIKQNVVASLTNKIIGGTCPSPEVYVIGQADLPSAGYYRQCLRSVIVTKRRG